MAAAAAKALAIEVQNVVVIVQAGALLPLIALLREGGSAGGSQSTRILRYNAENGAEAAGVS
jgi:hypothetical protein